MNVSARDVRTRVALSRLLLKMEQQPKYSGELGLRDLSGFQRHSVYEGSEVNNNGRTVACRSSNGCSV